MNQREVKKMMSYWSNDAYFIFPGNMDISGEYHGKESITKFFENYMVQFPELHFRVKRTYISNILAQGLSNTVAIEFECEYTNRHGKTFKNSGVTVIEIKRGKTVKLQDYYFDLQRLEEAWA